MDEDKIDVVGFQRRAWDYVGHCYGCVASTQRIADHLKIPVKQTIELLEEMQRNNNIRELLPSDSDDAYRNWTVLKKT